MHGGLRISPPPANQLARKPATEPPPAQTVPIRLSPLPICAPAEINKNPAFRLPEFRANYPDEKRDWIMTQASTILIADDDPHIREMLGIALSRAGYETISATQGVNALHMALNNCPDLVVLDIGLPEIDGLEVCRRLRASSDVPVLFLTARDDELDRVLGLEMGADDYVTKPFSPRELVARVKAILKRSQRPTVAESPRHLTRGTLSLAPDSHDCRIGGNPVTLTNTEMALLSHLMRHPEQVISRAQLLDALYGTNIHVSERTLDSHLRNLRAKLAQAGCKDAIQTLHGVGIRMGTCAE